MNYNHQETLKFIESVTSRGLVESKTEAVGLAADVLGIDTEVITAAILSETPTAVIKTSQNESKKTSILNF
jgi:hypothetical protein